ncbi:hypothetical protein L208DRAFT_1469280 [Tricholoma matsutake]|nr:hypothetical protein L208DRAFT_1469280 [Tricholoma matsutake 945]
MRSVVNGFGVLREYHHRPSYDPDRHITPDDLANFRTGDTSLYPKPHDLLHPPAPWPFENMSKYLLMNWANSGSTQKTKAEIMHLEQEVLASPDFKIEELGSFNAHRENQLMDKAFASSSDTNPFSSGGWKEVKVDIEVPVASRTKLSPPPCQFSVPGLHFRSLVEVIKEAWSEDSAKHFHLSPFKRIHVHPETKAETHVFDEVYTSDAWIKAHDDLQKQSNEPECNLEKVIAGLMFWSDSTHLVSFGNASVWPLYMYFANQSKYIRAKPSSGACHHVAYIPSLPDSIDEFFMEFAATSSQRSTLKTHCQRELLQEVWRLLLDDEFLHAYEHGIVLTCADGIQQQVYPCLFTYSANYPEK